MIFGIHIISGGATPGRARAMSNDLAGRSTADRFICFVLTVWQWNNLGGVGGLRVLKATTKKSSTFLRKKCIRVTWLEDVLSSPRNDLAPLLRWRRHCKSCTVVNIRLIYNYTVCKRTALFSIILMCRVFRRGNSRCAATCIPCLWLLSYHVLQFTMVIVRSDRCRMTASTVTS